MVAEPHLSLIPPTEFSQDKDFDLGNFGSALVNSSLDSDRGAWLLDSGATDHMIFDENDFIQKSPPR